MSCTGLTYTGRTRPSRLSHPYLGGLINAILALVITCVNSQIAFPA